MHTWTTWSFVLVNLCKFLTDILINNAYMDYLELRFSELMQYEVEKRIHFE